MDNIITNVGRIPAGLSCLLDSQTTVPWVGTETPESSGVVPAMSLPELFELNCMDFGVVLFTGEFNLSRGTKSFREFILTDFLHEAAAVMGPPRHEGMLSTVKQVQRMVMDMISIMPLATIKCLIMLLACNSYCMNPGFELRNEVQLYEQDLPKLRETAEQAAANIIAAQKREQDQGKAQKKIGKTNLWLQPEMDALQGRKLCLEATMERRIIVAGKKLQALMLFLRKQNWMSDWLQTNLEAWEALDTVEAAAKTVAQKAPPPFNSLTTTDPAKHGTCGPEHAVPDTARTVQQSTPANHSTHAGHQHSGLDAAAAEAAKHEGQLQLTAESLEGATAVQQSAPPNHGTHGGHQQPGLDAAAPEASNHSGHLQTMLGGSAAVQQCAPPNHSTHGGIQQPGPDAAAPEATTQPGHLQTIAEGAAVQQSAPANHSTHGGIQQPGPDAAAPEATTQPGHLQTIAGGAAVQQSAPANHSTHGGHHPMATAGNKQHADTAISVTPPKAAPALQHVQGEPEPHKEQRCRGGMDGQAPVQNLDEAFAKVADRERGLSDMGPDAAVMGDAAVQQSAPANHGTHGGHQQPGPDAAAPQDTNQPGHLQTIANVGAAAQQSAPANHSTHGAHQHMGPDAAAAPEASIHDGHLQTIAASTTTTVQQSAPANHCVHGKNQQSGPDADTAPANAPHHEGRLETAQGAAAVQQFAPLNHGTHGGHCHMEAAADAGTNHGGHLETIPECSAAVQQSASANHGTHGGHQHMGRDTCGSR